jgi:hypothetical protein
MQLTQQNVVLVELVWVPGYRRIYDNEKRDVLANKRIF